MSVTGMRYPESAPETSAASAGKVVGLKYDADLSS